MSPAQSAQGVILWAAIALWTSGPTRAEERGISGVWLAERPVPRLLEGGRNEPPLRAEARTRYHAVRKRIASGDATADPVNWCVSPGFPRIATIATPFEITVRPDLVLFHYEWNRWARVVEMKADLDAIDPGPMGEASGHWAGRTLVVVSRDFLDSTYLDGSGLPHGAGMRTVEHVQLEAPDVLRVDYEITDPGNYSRPWKFSLRYRRQVDREIQEDVCLDRIQKGEQALLQGPSGTSR